MTGRDEGLEVTGLSIGAELSAGFVAERLLRREESTSLSDGDTPLINLSTASANSSVDGGFAGITSGCCDCYLPTSVKVAMVSALI